MTSFEDFGFGENDGNLSSGNRPTKLKLKANETARLSFGWWEGIETGAPNFDSATPRFRKTYRHYVENVGYFVSKGPEFVRLAGGDAPKLCIATVVVKWPLARNGEVDTANLLKGYSVHPWLFSQDKFTAFRTIHKGYSFSNNDLQVTCTDANFQKLMPIIPAPGNLLRQLMKKYPTECAGLIQEIQSVVAGIDREIAKDYSLDDLRAKLGMSPASSGPAASTDVDLDSMLSNVLD